MRVLRWLVGLVVLGLVLGLVVGFLAGLLRPHREELPRPVA
jgi:hypothetical protein